MNTQKLSQKIILKNILMNITLMIIFVGLNNWALKNNFEETFIFLALIYGVLVILLNALLISRINKL